LDFLEIEEEIRIKIKNAQRPIIFEPEEYSVDLMDELHFKINPK
jgi:hypothetical protein